MNLLLSSLRAVIKAYPAVIPHLKGKARWVACSHPNRDNGWRFPDGSGWYYDVNNKTYDYFLFTLNNLVTSVYNGNLGGKFIDIMASLIYGQLDQAYRQAWDEAGDGEEYPEYLAESFEQMYLAQFDFVDAYYESIVDARVDETPIDPLLARASLWANRWNEAHDTAIHLIALDNNENEEWILGETETHCPTCSGLNGIVARASDWDALGVRPQGAPNTALDCGGWNCDCSRVPTDKRRTRGGRDKIQSVISKG
jgi:hypothetical protein